jgi:microcystin-dependent protein
MSTIYITNPGGSLAADWTTVNLAQHYYRRNNFQIKAPSYNGVASNNPIYRLLDRLGDSSATPSNITTNNSTWRILHDTNTTQFNNPLQIWFDLSNSVVLSEFKLTNNNNIAEFQLRSVGHMDDTGGNELTVGTTVVGTGTGAGGSTNTYTITGNTSNNSRYYLLDITRWNGTLRYLQLTEIQFGYVPSPGPPVVTFPTGSGSTVNVTPNSSATSWEYSVNNGGNWIIGTWNGPGNISSFTLQPGTYTANTIQVRNRNSSSISSTIVSNASTITITEPLPPPVVTFPTSPGSTVNVTPNSNATSWEYSLNTGSTWTTGTGNSFTLQPATYAINSIQVRNSNASFTSSTVNNTSQIIVAVAFTTTAANNKKTELATLITNLAEVNTVKEIYELWYNTTQSTGGTDVWVYYVYDAQSDNSIIYNTRRFRFNPDTETWAVSNPYVNASGPVSVSSNGLSTNDKINYAIMYTGLEPFQINVSTDSLTSLKSVYDASSYPANNISVVHNIWYDDRDIFDISFSKTTRAVDAWIYVLTDATVVNDTMIFETRKVKYTITNNNATYEWTIPTDETVASATLINTQYVNIPNSSNFVLSYFYFDAYMITNTSSIKDLRSTYRIFFTDTKTLTTVNELWYDKSNLTPGDTIYDTSYNDTNLTVDSIDLILYGIKQDLDANNVQSNTQWTKINIKYSKKTRNWSIVSNSASYSSSINSGITDNLSSSGTSGFKQILSNILYGISGKVSALKTAYNNLYNPDIITLGNLWTTNSASNITPMFIFFSTSAGPLYTTAIYDSVIDSWSFNNQSEPYNAALAIIVIYTEFLEAALEGKLDNIKTAYTAEFANRSIVNVHKLWYNTTTTSNAIIGGKIYHSYNSGPTDTKLFFGLVDVSYNTQINIDNYSVAGSTFVSKNYNENNVPSGDYTEVASYNVDVSFNVNTSLPIMMNNSTIRAQFDASYNVINSTSLTINIHNVWIETGTINGTNMNYMTPIQDMWVYYSFLNNSNVTEYKSRILSYDLQLNVWLLTISDAGLIIGNTIKNGTIRTSGLTTGDLTNYTKIFESLPETPVFSSGIASSSDSLNNLETAYATSQSIASNSLEIYKIWYRIADARAQFVKCVVYLSISTVNGSNITKTYKTFIVNYNNDTNTWSIPDPLVQTTSTEADDKFSIIISGENIADYFMFYSLPTGPSVLVSNNNILMNGAKHLHLPVGSILMYHKNSITLGSAFLNCDGAEYDVSAYPELAGVLDYKYGGTLGTKFNVPDLLDRLPIGADNINDSSISTDKNMVAGKRKGGSWTIGSDQFVHSHPNISREYIYDIRFQGNMDNENPTSPADIPITPNPNQTITQSGAEHKPPYFVVKYVIYTGRGIIV